MSSRIEAYLYGTGEASMAAAVGITVTEPGPVVYTARLLAPARLADALTAWAAALTASALVGTYTLSWDSAAQAVTISATGVASFGVEFGGNLAAALGFSTASGHTGALSYTGDQQALARFDRIWIESVSAEPHDGVELHRYRHGRHRAIAWSDLDVITGRVYAHAETLRRLSTSYCAAGLVRVHVDSSVGAARAIDEPWGYVDGMVLALDDVELVDSRDHGAARIVIGVPRG